MVVRTSANSMKRWLSSGVENSVVSALNERFKPIYLKIVNESKKHSGSTGAQTHFRLTIVSKEFDGLSSLKRHRLIFETLKNAFSSGLHALSINAKSPNEPLSDPPTPPCPGHRFS
ncbi:unnamed protein product [Dicrocoelium dendriticum]|nr:unnamed protein product [Dicrocoelium dendriticum]